MAIRTCNVDLHVHLIQNINQFYAGSNFKTELKFIQYGCTAHGQQENYCKI